MFSAGRLGTGGAIWSRHGLGLVGEVAPVCGGGRFGQIVGGSSGMVMFSELRRFYITDETYQRVRLDDLAVALLDAEYPPVTQIYFWKDEKFWRLGWDAVRHLNFRTKEIKVADLGQAEEISKASIAGDVLLGDDVLDALILDLLNRRTTRANDLQLQAEDHYLTLRAVDSGIGGMLRRISGGYYRYVNPNTLYDWKYVEFLRGDPQAVRSGAGYNLRINRLPPGEIAELTNYIPYLHAAELLTLLPNPKAADTLEAMSIERQIQVFEEFDEDQGVAILSLMSPDIAADLTGYLPQKMMKRYLERLPKKQSERILELLRYPEDTVGGVMTNDMLYVRTDLTIAETRERLRELLKGPDFISLIFAVEDETSRRLRGVISLRRVLVEDDDKLLEDLIYPFVETLHPLDWATAAAYRMITSQLPAMPVVQKDGKLVGVMTIDAAIKQIAPLYNNLQALRVFS